VGVIEEVWNGQDVPLCSAENNDVYLLLKAMKIKDE